MAEILFVERSRFIHKEEIFLELVIPLISANQIDALNAALKTKWRKPELEFNSKSAKWAKYKNWQNILISKEYYFKNNK